MAVVTGAASGIGHAVAKRLAAAGWSVLGVDLNSPDVDVAEDISYSKLDVTDSSAVKAFFAGLVDMPHPLRLLVNSAGVTGRAELVDMDVETWRRVIGVNLDGTFNCMNAAGPLLLANEPGTVVNLSSIAASRGGRGRGAYAVSKAAVEALTRTAAIEWAASGVTANAIAPGFTDTRLFTDAVERGTLDLQAILGRVPMGRLASPEEIADLVLFLSSDSARFITGQTILIDGGYSVDYAVTFRSE